MNKCIECGKELILTNEVTKCSECQVAERKEYYPFLEPNIKPSAYIGIKCPHCGKEISMVTYKMAVL